MKKQYYGVYDTYAGKLRNGFVYSNYNFAKKDVAQGIVDITDDSEILELPDDDYDMILSMHGFQITQISPKIAHAIEDKEAFFVKDTPDVFYDGEINN